MNTTRFATLLERHGPTPARWPAADRAAAEALLAGSAEARALLAAAAALDMRLRQALPQPDAAAITRLQEGVARRIARAPLPAPPGWRQWLLAALRPAVPAGWGALAALATCALWLSIAPPEPSRATAEDPLAPLQTLPVAGEFF
jgi:hypothetical protein